MTRVSKYSVLSLAVLFAMLVGLLPMGAFKASAQDESAPAAAESTVEAAATGSLSRTTGVVGDSVTFEIFGFGNYETVAIVWDNDFEVRTPVTTNGSGYKKATFRVPSTPKGNHAVYFIGQNAHSAVVAFKVTRGYGDWAFNTYSGRGCEDWITWDVFWDEESSVTVIFDSTGEDDWVAVDSSTTAADTGYGSGSFQVPCEEYGYYEFLIVDGWDGSGIWDSTIGEGTFEILPDFYLTLDIQRGPAGTVVPFWLENWPSYDTVDCGWDDQDPIEFPFTNGDGDAYAEITVPDGMSSGEHLIYCTYDGVTFTQTFVVDNTSAEIDPAVGLPTAVFSFTVSGFMPFTNVSVSWDGTEQAVVVTDANGDADGTLTVPANAAPGEYTVTFEDGTYFAEAVYTVITPAAAIATNVGQPGSSVTFTLTDWIPNSEVSVRWDGTEQLLAETDNDGAATGSLIIPINAINGNHTISFTQNGFTRSKTFLVVRPTVTVNKLKASAGNTITYMIAKFPANSPFTVTFGGVEVGSGMTDSDGEAYGSFIVPSWSQSALPGVETTYPVVWSSGQWSAKVIMTIAATPKVTLSQNHGYQGQKISFTLTKFKPNTYVTIRLSGITLAKVRVDANGFAKGTFKVPGVVDGKYQVRVWDSNGYLGAITFYVI